MYSITSRKINVRATITLTNEYIFAKGRKSLAKRWTAIGKKGGKMWKSYWISWKVMGINCCTVQFWGLW